MEGGKRGHRPVIDWPVLDCAYAATWCFTACPNMHPRDRRRQPWRNLRMHHLCCLHLPKPEWSHWTRLSYNRLGFYQGAGNLRAGLDARDQRIRQVIDVATSSGPATLTKTSVVAPTGITYASNVASERKRSCSKSGHRLSRS